MQTKHLLIVALGLVAEWTEAGKPQVCLAPKTITTTISEATETSAAQGQQIEIVQGGNSGSSGSSGSGSSGYEIIGSGGSGGSSSSGSYGSSGESGSGVSWYDNYEPVLGGPYESWGGGAATAYGNGNFKDYLSIGYYDCNSYGYSNSKTKAPVPWSQPTTSASAGPTNRYPPKASYRSYSYGNGSYYSQPTSMPSSKPTPAPSSTRSYPSARPSSTGYCVNSPSNRQCWGQYNIDTDYNQITPDTGVTQEVCYSAAQLIAVLLHN